MLKDVSIGFVGFGEAGFEIAKGLRSDGFTRMVLYDSVRTDLLKKRAEQAGVEEMPGLQELAERSELILSVVPPGISSRTPMPGSWKRFAVWMKPSNPSW